MALAAAPLPRASVRGTDLSKEEIRTLALRYGRYRLQATSRFWWLLPFIAAHRIYLEDGCSTLYEWASKNAGMGKEEVDRMWALFKRIGQFDCLWDLLGESVGVSKLERVAPHVTAENAAWLAEQVKRLPKPQLEQLLGSLRSPAASRAHPARSEAPSQGATIRLVPQPAPGPGLSQPGSSDRPAASHTGSSEARAETGPLEEALENASQDAGAPASPPVPDAGTHEVLVEVRSIEEAIKTTRLTLELDPVGEKRIRELREICERAHGRPIGLGELFAMLAQGAIQRGGVPGLEAGPEAEAATAEPDSQPDSKPASPREGELGSNPGASGTSRPRATIRARILEVVVSIAETGWRFIRTAVGWVPVAAGALAGFLDHGQPIPLANLRLAAIASAEKAEGTRHIPAAVERYIVARSGAYCEVAGCKQRMAEIHHRKRFALDPTHHPDELVAVCEAHHGSAHDGLICDESLPPASWRFISPGEAPRSNQADRLFQAYRAEASADRG